MMSEAKFDAQLQSIEDQADAMQERVDGYRDQRLAKLFVESDWSQEKLAEHLSKRWEKEVTRQWIAYRLRFGRFLAFFATTCFEDGFKLPPNFTEGGFRKLWDATEPGGNFTGHRANTVEAQKDENRRFGEVMEALKGFGLRRKQKPVKKAIIAVASKGQWHTAEELREQVQGRLGGLVLMKDITDSLSKHMQPTPDAPYRLEKAGEGEEAKYRLLKVKGQVPGRKQLQRWAADLVPMMEDLIKEAGKDRVEVSLVHLCAVAGKIKKVLESMTAKVEVSP